MGLVKEKDKRRERKKRNIKGRLINLSWVVGDNEGDANV